MNDIHRATMTHIVISSNFMYTRIIRRELSMHCQSIQNVGCDL